jgi:hypothetical protein
VYITKGNGMNEQHQAGSAVGAVDPSNFDFNAYISGTATFPEFDHTVYLDQRSGIQLHELTERYDKLAERGREILRIRETMSESPTRSFVDDEAEQLTAELEEIEKVTAELAPKINEMEGRIRQSALKLVFQVGTPQKLGSVVRQAEKEFHKKHGRKDDSDLEYITARSKAILSAQLAAYCIKIVLADGREQDPPNADGFVKLLDSLISSESVRLMTTMNKSLDSSGDWADKIDAGFPGGRAEPVEEPVAGTRSEDRPVMDLAPADTPDGGGNELGG